MPDVRFSFEPADIVSEVMSFGSPTPVEVAVNGPNLAENRAYAEKIRAELAGVSSLRDLQFVQALDYPTVSVQIDREKAGLSGVSVAEVARSVVAATSSSRFVVPNYWPDPKTGIGYQVQVEIPYQAHELARRGRDHPDPAAGRRAAPAPRHRHGEPGDDAGRIRSLQHEARGQPDGERRRRGPGPGRRPDRPRHRRVRASLRRGPPSRSAARSCR